MKNVLTRSITGILYIAAIVGALVAGGWWTWALVMLFGLLGVSEFNRITNRNFVSNTTTLLDLVGTALLITICAPQFIHVNDQLILGCIIGYIVYIMLRLIVQLYVQDGNPLAHLAHSILGQVYVALPLMLLEFFYMVAGWHIVLSMFILIWVNDTGAFCVGSLIGKHKLFERISPKKSWEGFIGGLAFCLIASAAFFYIWPDNLNGITLPEMLVYGAIVCVFSTWGDLVESMIKRALGVKDSGNILPGHGGILDRIDSLLLVAPASFVYFMLLLFR